MALNLHVDGHCDLFSHPNTSHLDIELRTSGDLVIPISPYDSIVASQLHASFMIPMRVLLDPFLCRSHIRYELSAVFGVSLSSAANAELVTQLVSSAQRFERDNPHTNTFGSYYFSVDMELRGIQLFFDEEYGLLVEEVTSGTSTAAISAEEKEELGSCCICLEEMSCVNSKELASLPCQHVFHENCIIQWLDNSTSCPLCRAPLEHY